MKSFSIAALILAFLQFSQSPTGIIEGVVVRTDGRTPLSGVHIQIEEAFPSSRIRKPFAAETTTDGGGRFTVRDVPGGEFAVKASLEGYLERVVGSPAGRSDTRVFLNTGQRAQVSLELTAASRIRGRITDSNDHPIASADVRILQQYMNEDGRPAWRGSEYRGGTDENGEYRITLVPPGNYYVRIAREVDGVQGFVYFPGTSQAGDALALSVSEGVDAKADIRIPPVQAATLFKVSGRLVHTFPVGFSTAGDGADPFPPPGVTLIERSRSLLGKITLRGVVDPATGRFEIMRVPSGAYELLATIAVGQDRYLSLLAIDIRDHDVEDVTVSVLPGVDVRAHIVVDGDTQNFVFSRSPAAISASLAMRDGDPSKQIAGNVWVSLQGEDISHNSKSFVEESGTSIVFQNVPNGSYRISAGIEPSGTRLNPDFYVDDVRVAGRSVYDTGIRVGVDPVDSIEIVIGTRGGSLEGTIPRKGKTAATLILLPDSFRRGNPALYKRELIPASDEKGVFRLRGIAPGTYRIFALPDTGESLPFRSPEFAARYESRGVQVVIQKGSTAGAIQIPLLER